ncbi:hypothetical protein DFH27DRAFT_646084 [Peziza echinospora]|nr:hypothetical protein DFH27DRAFT_646084 [Peziza echinospora]
MRRHQRLTSGLELVLILLTLGLGLELPPLVSATVAHGHKLHHRTPGPDVQPSISQSKIDTLGILGRDNSDRSADVGRRAYCRMWGHGSVMGDNKTVVIYGGMMTFKEQRDDSTGMNGVGSDGEMFFFPGFMTLDIEKGAVLSADPLDIPHHRVTPEFISKVANGDQSIIARGIEYTLYPSVWAMDWENIGQLMYKFGGSFLPTGYWGENPPFHKETSPPRYWQAGLGTAGEFQGYQEVVPGKKSPKVRGDILGDDKWAGPLSRVEGAGYVSGRRLGRGWLVGGWRKSAEKGGWEVLDVGEDGGMWDVGLWTKEWRDVSAAARRKRDEVLEQTGDKRVWYAEQQRAAGVGRVAMAAVVDVDRGAKMGDGFLLLLGGVTVTGDDALRTTAELKQKLRNRSLDTVDVYDVANNRWYKQSTAGEAPRARAGFCAAAVKRVEGDVEAGWDIYIFGGVSLADGGKEAVHSDVWVLLLPSFTWARVHDGAGRAGRFEHTCHVVNHRSLLVIGGRGAAAAAGNGTSGGAYDERDETKGGWKIDAAGMGCYNGSSRDGMTSAFDLTTLRWVAEIESERDARKYGAYRLNETIRSALPLNNVHTPQIGWDDALFADAWVNGTYISPPKHKKKVPLAAIVAPAVIGAIVLFAFVGVYFSRCGRRFAGSFKGNGRFTAVR